MNKRIISSIIILLLIFSQFITFGSTAYAEGELVISDTHIEGGTKIDGKPFALDLGVFNMRYDITTSSSDQTIKVVEVKELLTDNNNKTINEKTISIGKEIKTGENISLGGNSYKVDAGSAPYTLTYTFRYEILDDSSEGGIIGEGTLSGQRTINVANTSVDASFSTGSTGPFYKGDEVNLTAEITSKANVDLYNLEIVDSVLGTIDTIGVLKSGGTAKVTKSFGLSSSTEGKVTITYDDPLGGSRISKVFQESKIAFKVQGERSAKLEVQAVAKPNMITSQTEVAFNISIKNSGNTKLENLKLRDWNNNSISTPTSELEPGQTVEMTYTALANPNKEYTFRAEASAKGQNQTVEASTVVFVQLFNPLVELERTFVPENIGIGEPFTIEYVLRNTGNVEFKDIVVEEPDFGEVATYDSLGIGEAVNFSKEFTVEEGEDKSSSTIVKAVDVELNNPYEYMASELEIPIQSSEEMYALSMSLVSDKKSLSKPGAIELECLVKNTGSRPLYNLEFKLIGSKMESENTIDSVAVLEPEEEKTIKIQPFRLEETQTFTMLAEGMGEDQYEFSQESEPLVVEVTGKSTNRVMNTILIIILAFVIMIIGAVIYLIYGTKNKKFTWKLKRKKKSKDQSQNQK